VHDLIPRSVAQCSQRYAESWAMTALILCKHLLSTYDTMDTLKRETSESIFILVLPCNVGFSGACKRTRMADRESTWNQRQSWADDGFHMEAITKRTKTNSIRKSFDPTDLVQVGR
jgi:hypothetical protein